MSFEYHGPLIPGHPLYQQRAGLLIDEGHQRIEDLSTYIVNACLRAAKTSANRYFTINASRQSGKTSLLLNIEKRIQENGGYACWIDFQWAYGAAPEPAINFMAQQIVRSIPELEASVQVPDKFDHDGFGFDNWLKRLPLPGTKPLVLLLEELGALPHDSRTRLGLLLRGAFSGRFETNWKHVVLIFFGGIELNDMITIEVSPLFNICENIHLLDLDATDTHCLIASGFDQPRDSMPAELRELSQSIYAQVSGHPYLTQFLGEQALIHTTQTGSLLAEIQTGLFQRHMEDSKYLDHLLRSIQKYKLVEVVKSLLETSYHPDKNAIRELTLLGILGPGIEKPNPFRNQLIRQFLDKSIRSDGRQVPAAVSPDNTKIEAETRLIRDAKVQDLLEKLVGFACLQTTEGRHNVLTKIGIIADAVSLDLGGTAAEAVPRLFHFLEKLPRFKNDCFPLGMFLVSANALSPVDRETTRLIDEFISQYGLMESNSAIFVSYAWGGESERMVVELEQAFAERGLRIMRDKKELAYAGSIQEFEQRLGRGGCILLVISDKYLRSEHCMYELVEIAANKEFSKRVFPVVLNDAQIYDAAQRMIYIQFWQEKISRLDEAMRKLPNMTGLPGIAADLDKYGRIRANFDNLTKLLSDMNTLTPETHATEGFETLINAVVEAQQRTS